MIMNDNSRCVSVGRHFCGGGGGSATRNQDARAHPQ